MKAQNKYQPNETDVIYENFGNEVVLINLKTGIYYSLTDTALMIWTNIVKRTEIEDIISGFADKDDSDRKRVGDEIKRFISELEKENLIIPSDTCNSKTACNTSGVSPQDSWKKHPFSPPVLEKYTDQQELLLLDPIHDVSDLGWPDQNRDMPDED
jgi:hypothetical protein